MPFEFERAQALAARLQDSLQQEGQAERRLRVTSGTKLAYAHEVRSYDSTGTPAFHVRSCDTDVFVAEHAEDGSWKPRIVIEGNRGAWEMNDVLRYNAKAAGHKAIHPALRYGFVSYTNTNLDREMLMRYGAQFDFMAVWRAEEPQPGEWDLLYKTVRDEIQESRLLESELLPEKRSKKRTWRVLHRKLERLMVEDEPPVEDVPPTGPRLLRDGS